MRLLGCITLVLLGSTCSLIAQPKKHLVCDSRLALSLPIGAHVAKVSDLRFTSEFARSNASFQFKNAGSLPIVSAMISIEFEGQDGKPLLSMFIHAFDPKNYKRHREAVYRTLESAGATQFDKPMGPGQTAYWGTTSPFFSTECPVSAYARFVEIQFEDASERRFVEPKLLLEPVVLDASYFDPGGATFTPPFETMVTLAIDSRGSPSVIDISNGSQEFTSWIQSWLSQWKFSPSYLDTSPVAGELKILFRFHEGTEEHVSSSTSVPMQEIRVFQVVDVFSQPSEHLWRVYLGGSVVSSNATAAPSNHSSKLIH